jgi:hypothetical protein
MNEDNRGSEQRTSESTNSASLTRSELYELVWAEPMLKVAARFEVSSSYMARVCTLMNVPRPEHGYWAKLAVGQQLPKPDLRDIRPGDLMVWNRSGIDVARSERRPLPRAPAKKPKRKPAVEAASPADLHPLIHGARAHFDVASTSYDSQYLKPAKQLLVDLVVSKTGLDKALAFANQLFRELEAHDCRVVIASHGERMGRPQVDENEIPRKNAHDDYRSSRFWSPGRVTVVYVGTVAVGLTIVELSEQAEARYVKG